MAAKQTSAARVVVVKPGAMTLAGRKRIAKWLRSRADWLEKHGDLAVASGNWTARYMHG